MSGFVETLLSTKVHPLEKKDEEEERQQNKTNTEMRDHMSLKPKNPPNMDQVSPQKRDCKSTPGRKELVPENFDTFFVGERREADVEIVRLWIVCPGRPEIALFHPLISSPKVFMFTLKEGTKFRLKFSFTVSNKVVSGLSYENTLWKAGIRVDRSTILLGTFSPQKNSYNYQLVEETLPSGILVRGLYSARARVIDRDGKCYKDIHYRFDIRKKWPSSS